LITLGVTNVAEAKRIPVFFGYGEKVVEVSRLSVEAKQQLPPEMSGAAVGFMYHRFHVFWCDLWTWDGRFVLFKGDTYWKLTDSEFAELLGKGEFELLSKPWLYRFPLGLVLLAAVSAVAGGAYALFPSRETRARRLLKNPIYQQSVAVYKARAASALAAREDPAAAFQTALQHLRAHGEPADRAEANMRFLIEVFSENSAAQKEEAAALLLNRAVAHEQAGEWQDAIVAYEGAANLLNQQVDLEYVQNRVGELRQKVAEAKAQA
jgi:hypothetical protein